MTLRQMLEYIQVSFPEYTYSMGIIDLNNAIREFTEKTGLPYAEVTLTKANSYVSFDDERQEWLWTLPSDVYEIRHIDEIYYEEIRVNGTSLYLAFLSDITTKIRLEYVRVPTALQALTDQSEIPAQFHECIVNRVLEKLFAAKGNAPMAQYCRDRYNDGIKEGKKFYNTRQWRNLTSVGGSGGGTSTTNKKRVSGTGVCVVAGKNTITIGAPGEGVTMANNSYTLVLNGNGIWVTAVDPDTQLVSRTTTTFDVWAADDTCNFEYILEGS